MSENDGTGSPGSGRAFGGARPISTLWQAILTLLGLYSPFADGYARGQVAASPGISLVAERAQPEQPAKHMTPEDFAALADAEEQLHASKLAVGVAEAKIHELSKEIVLIKRRIKLAERLLEGMKKEDVPTEDRIAYNKMQKNIDAMIEIISKRQDFLEGKNKDIYETQIILQKFQSDLTSDANSLRALEKRFEGIPEYFLLRAQQAGIEPVKNSIPSDEVVSSSAELTNAALFLTSAEDVVPPEMGEARWRELRSVAAEYLERFETEGEWGAKSWIAGQQLEFHRRVLDVAQENVNKAWADANPSGSRIVVYPSNAAELARNVAEQQVLSAECEDDAKAANDQHMIAKGELEKITRRLLRLVEEYRKTDHYREHRQLPPAPNGSIHVDYVPPDSPWPHIIETAAASDHHGVVKLRAASLTEAGSAEPENG